MEDSFYKESIVLLEGAITDIIAKIDVIKAYKKAHNDRVPIEYVISRVKSEESMKEKLKRKGLEVNLEKLLKQDYALVKYQVDNVFSKLRELTLKVSRFPLFLLYSLTVNALYIS